jgi:hypothetical protein
MHTEELVLLRELRVVLTSDGPNCLIATLRGGARVSITGKAPMPGFVEVACAKVRYYVLEQALRQCSVAARRHHASAAGEPQRAQ